MARIIAGRISGKVGDKVYSISSKGNSYVKSLPKRSAKPATAKQTNQRQKMKLAVQLISELREFLTECFSKSYSKHYSISQVIKHILTEGITGTYPDLQVDFARLKITRGSLAPPLQPEFVLDENRILQINWDGLRQFNAYPSDELLLMLCEQSHRRIWVWPGTGVTRSEGRFCIDFSRATPGQELHLWLAFRSEERIYSDSVYAGSIQIPLKTDFNETV